MAQFARPDGDVTRTGIGGGTYASIDESSYSDADFIYGNENTAVTYECSLTNPTDPSVHTGHIFRYRIGKLNDTTISTSGNAVYCTVSLYQGATLIKADSQKTAGNWTSYELTLSESEAGNITDYTDLRLRFVSPASGGSASTKRAIGISWAEMEVPDAGPQTYYSTPSGDVTPDGAVVKSARKTADGELTLSGVVSTIKTVLKALDGALTSAGALINAARKVISGAITPAGEVATSKIPGSSGIALVQSKGSIVTGQDSANLSFDSTPSIGNLIVVAVASYNGDLGTSAVTDNQGNTYSLRKKQDLGGGSYVGIYRAIVGTASGTFTVTVNPDGSSADFTFSIAEFSGIASSPDDLTNGDTQTGTSVNSLSITPTENNSLWVGAMTHTTTDISITETNGTLIYENQGGSSNMPLSFVYEVQTIAASEAATWTIGASATWGAIIVSFKPPAGGGEEYDQSVSGEITPDGSLSRAGRKPVDGALTSSGTLVNSARKILDGALTSAGALINSARKIVSGEISAAGLVTGIKTALVSLAGAITPSGEVRTAARKVLDGALTSAGALVNSTRKIVSGALTSAGTLINSTRKIVAGALTSAGDLIANKVTGATTYYQTVTGALAPGGAVATAARKILDGALTSAGVVVKAGRKAVAGALSSSSALAKSTQKVLEGVITPVGEISKRIWKVLSGILTTVGILSASKQSTATRTATVTLWPRDFDFTLDSRGFGLTLETRTSALTMEERSMELNLQERNMDWTVEAL